MFSIVINSSAEKAVSETPEYNATQKDSSTEVINPVFDDSIIINRQKNLENMLNKNSNSKKQIVKELVEKRTASSKKYLLSDGSYLEEISKEGLHYQDADGGYHDIVTGLIDVNKLTYSKFKPSKENVKAVKERISRNMNKTKSTEETSSIDSTFIAPQVPFSVEIPKDLNNGYSISKGDSSLKYIPVNALSSQGELKNDIVLYPNVWKNTDIKLTVTNSGVKEDIILKNEDSPKKFSFEVVGDLTDQLKTKDLIIQPAWLIDNDGQIRDVTTKKVKRGSKVYLELEWDHKDLTYPVVIDPTTTQIVTIDAYVNSIIPNENFEGSQYLYVGQVPAGQRTATKSALFKGFSLSSIPTNATVTHASLRASVQSINYSKQNTSPSDGVRIQARRLKGWPSTSPTYSNFFSIINSGDIGGSLDFNRNSLPGFYYWDMTSFVQQSLGDREISIGLIPENNFTGYGAELVLRAYEHPCRCDTTALLVNYQIGENHAPYIYFEPTTSFKTNKPVFKLHYSDPDQHRLMKYELSGENISDNSSYSSGETRTSIIPSVSSFTHDIAKPLSEGIWNFRVRGFDGAAWGNYYYNNNVVIDITPPTTPTNLYISGLTPSTAILSWSLSTDNVGIDYYSIYKNDVLLGSVSKDTNAYKIDVALGKTDKFKVKTVDLAGNSSENTISHLYNNQRLYIYVYDANGRLDYIKYTSGDVVVDYTYDANGNLINVIRKQ